MINEELMKKAKELGISDEEIAEFIKNEKDAEKYGFIDDCTSFTVQIDKDLDPDEEEDPINHCDCDCNNDHHCHCEHCDCNHDEEEDDEYECDCCHHKN